MKGTKWVQDRIQMVQELIAEERILRATEFDALN